MEKKSVLGGLFDMTFSEFVTIRVIKLLFMIGIFIGVIMSILVIVSGFKTGVMAGIGALILSPLVFLLYVLFARIWCEMTIVLFRIAENTGKMARDI